VAKRSHDLGFSGWRYFGVLIAETVNYRIYLLLAVAAKGHQNPKLAMIALVLLVISVVLLLWMTWIMIKLVFFKGQPYANAYGSRTLGIHWR
jgi:uncharacterized membrane protein YhaH (DUF805 family)